MYIWEQIVYNMRDKIFHIIFVLKRILEVFCLFSRQLNVILYTSSLQRREKKGIYGNILLFYIICNAFVTRMCSFVYVYWYMCSRMSNICLHPFKLILGEGVAPEMDDHNLDICDDAVGLSRDDCATNNEKIFSGFFHRMKEYKTMKGFRGVWKRQLNNLCSYNVGTPNTIFTYISYRLVYITTC